MPNIKIYVNETVYASRSAELKSALLELRDLLCRELGVGPEACQLAMMAVAGLPDQPLVNVELLILPRADRTPDAIRAVAVAVRSQISDATAGAHTAVRVSQLDPDTYVALK